MAVQKCKRDYLEWALAQVIGGLSKTPEQEILHVMKMKSGDYVLSIDADVQILIRKTKRSKKVSNGQ